MSVDSQNIPSDVTKVENQELCGSLKKLRSNKKKFFVLTKNKGQYRNSYLDYYDSEQKWKKGSLSRKTYCVNTCFNIMKKDLARNKFSIVLYTFSESFSFYSEDREMRECWYCALRDIWMADHSTISRRHYDYVWQVKIKQTGLGAIYPIVGVHRLCLSPGSLHLIKINKMETDWEFDLSSIRRCGHQEAWFYIELGRSSELGTGELWMSIEDSDPSHRIHEIVLDAMRTCQVRQMDDRKRTLSGGQASRRRAIPAEPRIRCGTLPCRKLRTSSDSKSEDAGSLVLSCPSSSSILNSPAKTFSTGSNCSNSLIDELDDSQEFPYANMTGFGYPQLNPPTDVLFSNVSLLEKPSKTSDVDTYLSMELDSESFFDAPNPVGQGNLEYMCMDFKT